MIGNDLIGKKVIIRGDRSGAFYGTLAEREGKEVRLTGCRRLWYWSGAASLSQLALEGVKNTCDSKFTVSVPDIVLLDAVEIIPCAKEAIEVIESVHVWKA